MSRSTTLRALLSKSKLVLAPGAYDALTARLVQQSGFELVYMTGAGVSAARGFPDFGLLTMSEMVQSASAIAQAVSIPVLADADTGYGNELNVTRAIREFERGGVAAIHIEDQVAPKRCGHLAGKEVTSREEFLIKIRAAVAAKTSPDFFVVARTDARAVLGFDEAIERANAACAAGANMAFVEAPETLEEVSEIPKRVAGPCLLNIVPGGKTPYIDVPDAQAMGYRVAILPGLLLAAVMQAGDAALRSLHETQHLAPPVTTASVVEAFRRFGSDEWTQLRGRFDAEARTGVLT